MNLQDNIVKMEEQVDKLKCEIASMKVKLKEQNKPKFKVGETVIVTSNSDTWEDEIVKITATHYHFTSGGHLQIDRQDVQLKQHNKLELKGGSGYYISSTFGVDSTSLAHKETVTRGAFRATKELAKIADKNMVTRNRLEAYVHQIQGDGEGRYTMFHNGSAYCIGKLGLKYLGTVYMKEKTAEILCKALNAGEIEL